MKHWLKPAISFSTAGSDDRQSVEKRSKNVASDRHPRRWPTHVQSENLGLALFLHIKFEIRQKEIGGYVALLMDIPLWMSSGR
jgi:hypothetical protein